ncbi:MULTISPECIES: cupin domain-containing protein [unclassified Myxococcus]|uniref:cupin domain-containing protein n=1 Tax=unclassified Myxococcus TaxID=2648731 RepID=UPI00157AFFF7|nr:MULTISPECIES: cupin domain-containing protein [unclassified Myxococcus]NTX05984.1 cupin domain-containing protein [Myxococcus sp. CA040A]NTX10598.1 cupin domain-containing protein [Myxococcus sp. CA056]NTX38232.1 cupin domain-containing protein [Myxococcus sp. CA033]
MVDELIRGLGLVPHPEGGFYKETYRAALKVETPRGTRSAGTAIYYLLTQDTFAAWHSVTSDEVWHFYEGAPLALYLVGEDGRLETVVLGRDVTKGEQPQVVVPAGVLQAGESRGAYSLVGCTVAPGFDFSDWEMPTPESLVSEHPAHSELMRRLSRTRP